MLHKAMLGKIIQCHIDYSDPETFVVGRLLGFDDEWFIMQDISSSGHWNGLALYMKSDIVSVSEASKYIERIEYLIRCRKNQDLLAPYISTNPLVYLLKYAQSSSHVLGLELYASGYRDVNGVIERLDDQWLYVTQVNEFGEYDGESYISINSITRCFIEDEESKCLELLMRRFVAQKTV